MKVILVLFSLARTNTKKSQSECQYYGSYYGHDIDDDDNIENFEDCRDICDEHNYCRYWTFDTLTGFCMLKHGHDGEPLLRPWLDMISGPRYC